MHACWAMYREVLEREILERLYTPPPDPLSSSPSNVQLKTENLWR